MAVYVLTTRKQSFISLTKNHTGRVRSLNLHEGTIPSVRSVSNFEQVLWNDSTLLSTIDQQYDKMKCLYQGSCSLNGENLLGRCFCFPGYHGEHCEHKSPSTLCTNRDDRCFYTQDGGVWAVSVDRWLFAQHAEHSAWKASADTSPSVGDRIDEHMRDFDNYSALGPPGRNLGALIEVGSGPWTQSLWMVQKRQYDVQQYILLEPGALSYMRDVKTCVYSSGHLPGFAGKTIIINAGGEHLNLLESTADTLVIVNVLEHVQNAISLLRNVFNALKPGGTIIFNDRWWDARGAPSEKMSLDTTYHPIRMKRAVFEQFLSGFETIYERTNEEVASFHLSGRNYNGTYFIGRRKHLCE
jgi:SAM-dependent methyltransferase